MDSPSGEDRARRPWRSPPVAGRVPPALAAALLAIATVAVAVAQDQPPATDSGQALVAREQGLRDQFRELG